MNPEQMCRSAKQVIQNAGYYFTGVFIIVFPAVWLLSFILSTLVIVRNPVTLWYTELWLFAGNTWLLFSKQGSPEKRKVIEFSIWVASIALIIAIGLTK